MDNELTYWGRVTHICVSEITIIGSDNDLSPGRRQAIIWTNAGILLFGPLGTNFSEISTEIHTFSFKQMQLKMSSGKWRPFCFGSNVLGACCVDGCCEFDVYSVFYLCSYRAVSNPVSTCIYYTCYIDGDLYHIFPVHRCLQLAGCMWFHTSSGDACIKCNGLNHMPFNISWFNKNIIRQFMT